MNRNVKESSISIQSLFSHSEPANKPPGQDRQTYFRGIRKFILRHFCGKEFNPRLQPTFKSEIHGTEAVLPPEILTEIFHHVQNDALDEIYSTHLVSTHACSTLRAAKHHLVPVVLSGVCRYWKLMITSNPLFWNTIFVFMESRCPEGHLRTWLERSSSIPVSICIDAGRTTVMSCFLDAITTRRLNDASFKKCVRIIHQHAPRILNLSLSLGDHAAKLWTQMLPPVTVESQASHYEGLSMDFRLLRDVDVRVSDGDFCLSMGGRWGGSVVEQDLASRICSRATSMTNLRFGDSYVEISGCPSFRPQLSAYPCFAGIRNLTLKDVVIDYLDLPSFLRDLSQLHHLRVLWIDRLYFLNTPMFEDDESLAERVALQSIHTLRLTISARYRPPSYWDDPENLFRRISTPNLTFLEVDSKTMSCDSWGELTNMLVASRCAIRGLILISDDRSFGYREINFLSSQVFSELEQLQLEPRLWMKHDVIRLLDGVQDIYGPLPEIPEYLVVHQLTPLSFPRLKQLVLYGCVAEDGLLANIARTRMLDGTLEDLYAEVEGCLKTHSEDIEVFSELRRQGRRAYLKSTPQHVLREIEHYKSARWYRAGDRHE